MTKEEQKRSERKRVVKNAYNVMYNAKKRLEAESDPEAKIKAEKKYADKQNVYEALISKDIQWTPVGAENEKTPGQKSWETRRANAALKASTNALMSRPNTRKSEMRSGYITDLELIMLDGFEQKFADFINGLRNEIKGAK